MSLRSSIARSILFLAVVLAACADSGPMAPEAPLGAPAAVAAGGAMPVPTITDLGSLTGAVSTQALAVNNHRQVVGVSTVLAGSTYQQVPWAWTAGGGMTAMDTPAGYGATIPFDINDAGAVVGYAHSPDLPLYWPSTTAPHERPPVLAGDYGGLAAAINEDGVIVGYSLGADRRAVRWPTPTTVEEFAPGYPGSGAWAINEAGNIAGYIIPGPVDAFFWSGGTMNVIGTLGGTVAYVRDMNDDDVLVGDWYGAGNYGFIWDAATGATTFLTGPDPSNPLYVSARAINNSGVVVGGMYEATYTAYYWRAADGMVALPGLVPGEYSFAYDINDAGIIVGFAVGADGQLHGVMWDLSATVAVVIDVRRVINVKGANGVVPVVVYSTSVDDGDDADFDASTIDPASVAFGPGGAGAAHGGHFADLDGDGDIDAMFHFRVGDSGVSCGDTEAGLTGSTTDGQAFTGTDTIRVVGC